MDTAPREPTYSPLHSLKSYFLHITNSSLNPITPKYYLSSNSLTSSLHQCLHLTSCPISHSGGIIYPIYETTQYHHLVAVIILLILLINNTSMKRLYNILYSILILSLFTLLYIMYYQSFDIPLEDTIKYMSINLAVTIPLLIILVIINRKQQY